MTAADALLYGTSLLASFVSVGLKGFQHKNVIAGHTRAIFVTSYLMAVGDVLTVKFILEGGWWMALTAGTGAAFGMVASVKLHDWLSKGKKVGDES